MAGSGMCAGGMCASSPSTILVDDASIIFVGFAAKAPRPAVSSRWGQGGHTFWRADSSAEPASTPSTASPHTRTRLSCSLGIICQRLREVLASTFGITHSTIQFEHTHAPGDFHRYMPEPVPGSEQK